MENTFKNVVMMQRIMRVRFKCEKVTYTTVEALSWKSETVLSEIPNIGDHFNFVQKNGSAPKIVRTYVKI